MIERDTLAEEAYDEMEKILGHGDLTAVKELEGKLSEILRIELVNRDLDAPQIMAAVALCVARVTLAISAVTTECGHEVCVRSKAGSINNAMADIAAKSISVAVRLPTCKEEIN